MKKHSALIACLASSIGLGAAHGQSDDFGYTGALTSTLWAPYCASTCTGAVTSTLQFQSAPSSAQIGDCTDILLPTSLGPNSVHVFTVNTFVVAGAPGKIRIALLNTLTGLCTPTNESAVIELDGANGVVFCKNNGASVPLVTGAWVELRVQIDLLVPWDYVAVTYNGTKFQCGLEWDNPANNLSVSVAPAPALACVGLHIENSTAGSTGFYYLDDVEFRCAVDVNRDGAVDFFDYDEWINCFVGNGCGPYTDADFNGDCIPDFFDFLDFMTAFQNGC